MFERMTDPYFRERVRDLDDVERRLLKKLLGFAANPAFGLNRPSVIVADDLTPSETVQIPRDLVLGFATNGGSATSHVALLARSMGIPAVTGLCEITSLVAPGDTVLLDGTAGTVTLSPNAAAIREFRDLVERQKEISEEALTGAPAGTLHGGGEILLYANLHPGAPFDGVKVSGARGVGLYRSEYLWLNDESEPSEEKQFEAYRSVAEFASTLSKDGQATIRVLDIGGDKLVRGVSLASEGRRREANPFLGNRSIRYLLSNQEVFKTQLRAILRASAFGKVRLLYPMISCVEELHAAAEVLSQVRTSLDVEGVAYDHDMEVGAMIEVPSAAINAASIAKNVDFLSIGTNDLVQYTMAADRGNDSVSHLYQPTNPAVLKLMRHVISVAKERGMKVSVCGESASDPIVGVLWAAMGVDELSMSATYIPVMSKLFSKLTRSDLDDYLKAVEPAVDDATAGEILAVCREWMERKIPDIANIVI
jgi:phosphotransferase system enzyme I (PtsI)